MHGGTSARVNHRGVAYVDVRVGVACLLKWVATADRRSRRRRQTQKRPQAQRIGRFIGMISGPRSSANSAGSTAT